MYAMTLDENLNFDWKQVPDPVRKADEVLIKVHAAGVNRADIMQKDGCYSFPGRHGAVWKLPEKSLKHRRKVI